MRGSLWGYVDPFQERLDHWSGRLKSAKDPVEKNYASILWQYWDRMSLEVFSIWADRDDLLEGDHKEAMDKILKK